MAAETEIFRLLMSMTGIRSIYSKFLQGPGKVDNPLALRSKLQELFPAASPVQLTDVALSVWQLSQAGSHLTNQFAEMQAALGANWPQDVVSGHYWQSTYQVAFSNAPNIPQFSVPTAPNAKYAVNYVVTLTTVNSVGDERIRHIQDLAVFGTAPTWQELTTHIFETIDQLLAPSRYNETATYNEDTHQPNMVVDFTSVIIIGA